MAFELREQLKGFWQSRPPLVLFMLCLGGFALLLVSLAYYVKVNALANPDVTEDWNSFLKNFADLEFCIYGNESDYTSATTAPTSAAPLVAHQRRIVDTLSSAHINTSKPAVHLNHNLSVSAHMVVEFHPTLEFLNDTHNVTQLMTTIQGKYFGLTGWAANEDLNVTVELPHEWNSTLCPHHNQHCATITILTCVTMYAQAGIFPDMSTRKPQCTSNSSETIVADHSAHMIGWKRSGSAAMSCGQRPMLRLNHEMDTKLTIMLSLHDRSLINLHLMHTSYFLFVMVITLFCYALIKGRHSKNKLSSQHSDKAPLHA